MSRDLKNKKKKPRVCESKRTLLCRKCLLGSFHTQLNPDGPLCSCFGGKSLERKEWGGPSSSAAIFVEATAQTTHSQSSGQCEVLGAALHSGQQKGESGEQSRFLCSRSTWQRPTGTRVQVTKGHPTHGALSSSDKSSVRQGEGKGREHTEGSGASLQNPNNGWEF